MTRRIRQSPVHLRPAKSALSFDELRTILRALELGINLLDTADAYAIGDNEELIGKTIRYRPQLEHGCETRYGHIQKMRVIV
jgi:diketogulonate reductase-like aldo/keto reductase